MFSGLEVGKSPLQKRSVKQDLCSGALLAFYLGKIQLKAEFLTDQSIFPVVEISKNSVVPSSVFVLIKT